MTHTSPNTFDWDEYARCYDAVRHLDAYMNMLESMFRACPLSNSSVVLDAGCGTGNLTELLAKQPIITIHAYDASLPMLTQAKQRCQNLGVQFKEHDLNKSLPFADSSIDIITSMNVLYALSNPDKILIEWYRVLQKGGSVILSTPKENFEMGFILREQVISSTKPESFWKGISESIDREIECVHEAFKEMQARDAMTLLAQYNKRIVTAGKKSTFHFFNEPALLKIIHQCDWETVALSETYAGQNWLVTLTK